MFQDPVNNVLWDLLNRFVLVYLDNIYIISQSPSEHKLHVCQVLQHLLEKKLLVKVEKCELHVPRVSFPRVHYRVR